MEEWVCELAVDDAALALDKLFRVASVADNATTAQHDATTQQHDVITHVDTTQCDVTTTQHDATTHTTLQHDGAMKWA